MERKLAIFGIVGMVIVLGFSAWFDLSGRRVDAPVARPTAAPTDNATARPPTKGVDNPVVERNRNERQGPSWSPADPVGEDGNPLTLGHAVPGALEPIEAGMSIQDAIATGLIERDPRREQACEGTFWKWKGDLAEGLDLIVGADRRVASAGMSKDGLETPEGISIGNSYGAVDATYGDKLEGPIRLDYGNAGVFLREGTNWIGFAFDNEPGRLVDDSRVSFIEVSRGARPGLLRDGC